MVWAYYTINLDVYLKNKHKKLPALPEKNGQFPLRRGYAERSPTITHVSVARLINVAEDH
jgi:hypothetical protein